MARQGILKTPEQLHEDKVKFTQEILRIIGEYILDGLSENDACVLSGMNPDDFKRAKEKDVNINLYVEKKKIEFEHKNLKEIKASDKNSMWLLEKLRPEKYGSKAKPPGEVPVDIVRAMIRDIQHDHNTANIITVEAEDATEKVRVTEIVGDVNAFLNGGGAKTLQ